jgi:predicted HTH domain antitoxin
MSEPTIDISFSVKEDILFSLQETPEEFTKEVLLLSALLFYRKRKLSLGKAAELAGYNRMDFIQKLQEEQEYLFDYSETEMNDIFDDVVKSK